MKLRQLQYVHEVVRNGLSVSEAAKSLHTSQPGISHQILALEEELKIDIFVRDKSRLVSLTANGEIIVGYITNVLSNINGIAKLAEAATRQTLDHLTVVATHTQARYILPDILRAFSLTHPRVRLSVRHCKIDDIDAALLEGDIDIAVIPTDPVSPKDLLIVNCREFRRVVVVPAGHPLLAIAILTLHDIAAYPLVMYEQSVPTRKQYLDVFVSAGISPNVVLNAINSDVIKACVESGLGIAILPAFVVSRDRDPALVAIDVGHLFPPAYSKIALHRRRPIRPHLLDFIQLMAPEWRRDELERELR